MKTAIRKKIERLLWLGVISAGCCLVLLSLGVTPVKAQSLPAVRWACSSRTIYLGSSYSDPALAAYPSQPGAPKQTINLAQLSSLVAGKCGMQMVENLGGGIWTVRANLVVSPTAKLEITNATVNELRLESILVGTTKQYANLIAIGGQILIQGATPQQKLVVHSWNTPANAVDTDVTQGRSYITILNGGRMDIINAEMAYLGWNEPNPNFTSGIGKGEPSGLSWKRRATADRPETGPTGSIIDSDVHHNYYGNYTWQAINMVFRGNKVHDNGYYGFDPHDDSSNFVVENNEFYNNYKHGLIFSRRCLNNIVRNNKMYNNGGHGFMLDRGSNFNTVENNELYGNGEDGITLYESSSNVFRNNNVHHNLRHGIRINAQYDNTDSFDALAIDNQFIANQVVNNSRYGFSLYDRADRNTFSGNTVSNNGEYGVSMLTGLNVMTSNTIGANTRDGILILGGPAVQYTPGDAPITPALALPGRSNQLTSNTISANRYNGILLKTETVSTTVELNTIVNNIYNGVLVNGTNSKANRITRNSITNNTLLGIKLESSGNNQMAAPKITKVVGSQVSGTTIANAKIEVFCDGGGEGAVFKASTTASSSGAWSTTATCAAGEGALTATATDSKGNTSPFSASVASGVQAAATDEMDQVDEAADIAATQAILAGNAAEAAEDMQVPDDDGSSSTLETLGQSVIDGEITPNGEDALPNHIYLPGVSK